MTITSSAMHILFGVSLTTMLCGCVTQTNTRGTSLGGTSIVTTPFKSSANSIVTTEGSSDELLDVYVLGSTENKLYGNGQKPDPLLNPKARPPAFQEDERLMANCTIGSLPDVTSQSGRHFLSASNFNVAMQVGLEAAKKRQEWNFYAARAKAQKSQIDATVRRLGPNGMERIKIQRELYLAEAHLPLQKRSMKARMNSPEMNQMVTLPEMQQRLTHNFAVLEKREISIKESEREYVMRMISLYEEAFNEFQSVSSSNSMPLLNKYHSIRQNNLLTCLKRVVLTEVEQSQLKAIDSQIHMLSRNTLRANQALISGQLARFKLIADKKRLYDDMFRTPYLQQLAQTELGIASPDGSKPREAGQGLTLN